ncbi:MAG: methyltetrahydrofolate cobalamin methyltransferase [Desulfatibacillaceae bacterium]
MLIIGELINASRKQIKEAIQNQDEKAIIEIAKNQKEAGADYIDVNAGVFVGKEIEYLPWLVKIVQENVDTPCCIDSPDPAAIEAALAVHKGTAFVNSISLEKDRYDKLLPVVKGSDCKVVALCMSDKGMPESTEDRFAIAKDLVESLEAEGVERDRIYVDPLVQPVSTNMNYGVALLKTIERVMTELSGAHTVCGLSNISFGLPVRKLLNQEFVTMAVYAGLDAVIMNPLDTRMVSNVHAALALAGRDEDCMDYLMAYRAEKLGL